MRKKLLLLGCYVVFAGAVISCGDVKVEMDGKGGDDSGSAAAQENVEKVEQADSSMDNHQDGDTINAPDSTAVTKPIKFSWKFSGGEEGGVYKGKVDGVVNGKEETILPAIESEYHEIERGEYEEWGVPKTAIAAAYTMSDNGGTVLYAAPKGANLVVYMKELKDMGGSEPKFKEFKTFAVK